jgi:hypothetical protein
MYLRGCNVVYVELSYIYYIQVGSIRKGVRTCNAKHIMRMVINNVCVCFTGKILRSVFLDHNTT